MGLCCCCPRNMLGCSLSFYAVPLASCTNVGKCSLLVLVCGLRFEAIRSGKKLV